MEDYQAPAKPNWQDYTDTNNKADVLRFLQDDGWQVKKQTFYNHCNQGRLQKNRNGLYTRRKVKRYAEAWLMRPSGKSVEQETGDLAARKTLKEIERIEVITRRENHKLAVEEGKFIPRSDFEAEMAARAVVIDNGLTHLIQSSVFDMIATVNGDMKKSSDLVALMIEKKDNLLNEYASLEQFQVIFDTENV